MSTIKANEKHPKVINNFYLRAHKNYNMVKEKGAMNYEIIDMKNKPKKVNPKLEIDVCGIKMQQEKNRVNITTYIYSTVKTQNH
jgi:hypothetical protein